MDKIKVTLYLSEEIYKWIRHTSIDKGVSNSQYIEDLVKAEKNDTKSTEKV